MKHTTYQTDLRSFDEAFKRLRSEFTKENYLPDDMTDIVERAKDLVFAYNKLRLETDPNDIVLEVLRNKEWKDERVSFFQTRDLADEIVEALKHADIL